MDRRFKKKRQMFPNLCPVNFFGKSGCIHLGQGILHCLSRTDLESTIEASYSAEQYVKDQCESKTRQITSWLRSSLPLKPVTTHMTNLVAIKTTCGGRRVVFLQQAESAESGWWLSTKNVEEVCSTNSLGEGNVTENSPRFF